MAHVESDDEYAEDEDAGDDADFAAFGFSDIPPRDAAEPWTCVPLIRASSQALIAIQYAHVPRGLRSRRWSWRHAMGCHWSHACARRVRRQRW